MEAEGKSVMRRRWRVLALAVGIASALPALAEPVSLQGLTFSDELGGLRIVEARGRGSLDDPFVLVEDITADGPAILEYDESKPVPKGYRVVKRSRLPIAAIGGGIFLLSYIPAFYVGAIASAADSAGGETGLTPLLIPVFVSTIRSTNVFRMALESKGFGASPKRTYFMRLAMGRRDVIVLAVFALLVIWKHKANLARLRAGTEPRIGRGAR